MTERYRAMLFSPDVRAAQQAQGSAAGDIGAIPAAADRLTASEADFITARDSFYLATAGADGWPYLQHRGGPPGFVAVTAPDTLAFADFRGNRQYISLGNLSGDDRVSLFFMDYVNRARLKVLGRMRSVRVEDAPQVTAAITDPRLTARVERVFMIRVEAFDWNCPQYITPRYTAADLAPVFDRHNARIAVLEQALTDAGLAIPVEG